ncbi:cell division protein FtsA [Savagea faecisuis]|uniref:Cell division protein FtsA n=1 Tax=Savagea faecisuis TaxID=1274803 RepID=A0ABW3GXL8_9BACL
MSPLLFSLDIGTRSVVGTIMKQLDDEQYEVIDLVQVEHKERAMIDGQIHNVLSVAQVIEQIKEQFEERHGPLKEVNVAAAGRALKTIRGEASIDLSERLLISTEAVQNLELAAVQEAHEQLMKQTKELSTTYYCVGYSVLQYELDGEVIGNLIDQHGQVATIKVIATFLPRVVIESLIHSLERAGLKMAGLTLEPIAAIHVLIPQSMRRLNVALVDIGAGTSDIAITSDNTISAYGMVPIAGDEITEQLSNHYLLDFPIAEQIKRQWTDGETVEFEDILGMMYEATYDELLSILSPSIDELATSISEQILSLNGDHPPQAVMVIGGGSLTPTLTERVSEHLKLPQARVQIRDTKAIKNVIIQDNIQNSPALVTPIGIALAAQESPIQYVSISVNGRDIRLFELSNLTVGDVLINAQINVSQLFGKPGLGMSLTVNGQFITVPGEHGTPSIIQRNGELVSIKSPVADGDSIEVIPGKKGKDAVAKIEDLIEKVEPLHITINGEPHTIEPTLTLNGEPTTLDQSLKDRDVVEAKQLTTVGQCLEHCGVEIARGESLLVKIDGRPHQLKPSNLLLYMNGQMTTPQTAIQNGAVIQLIQQSERTLAQIAKELNLYTTSAISVQFNGELVNITRMNYTIFVNEEEVTDLQLVVTNEDDVSWQARPTTNFMFSDVFAHTDFELPTAATAQYQLSRNGNPAEFTDPIFNGDELAVNFF